MIVRPNASRSCTYVGGLVVGGLREPEPEAAVVQPLEVERGHQPRELAGPDDQVLLRARGRLVSVMLPWAIPRSPMNVGPRSTVDARASSASTTIAPIPFAPGMSSNRTNVALRSLTFEPVRKLLSPLRM